MSTEAIDRNEQNELPIIESRRAFLGACVNVLAGITIIGCGGAALGGCEPTTTAPVPDPGNNTGGNTGGNNGGNTGGNTITLDVASLDADGKAFVTAQRGPDGKRILIVRRGEAEYLALSMACTHQNNEVAAPRNGVITCPYHGSQFDLTGAVKVGPATAPLRRYETTLEATTKKLTVKLS